MNRIDRIFADLRQRNQRALMPYITCGDPDIQTTGNILKACQRAGASICELGFPFSDPIADGPVIQASMTYALDHGAKSAQVFDMVRNLRADLELGLVAMVSYSIVHRLGRDDFFARCADVGIDGLIIPDLPLEEAGDLRDNAAQHNLTASHLIAPTTPIDRARKLAQASSGFVYLLARGGITGERSELPPDLPDRINQLRDVTDLPIAVGFGIATPQQVASVVSVADAAIVGSAIVRRIGDNREQGGEALVNEVESFVRELAGGLTQTAAVT